MEEVHASAVQRRLHDERTQGTLHQRGGESEWREQNSFLRPFEGLEQAAVAGTVGLRDADDREGHMACVGVHRLLSRKFGAIDVVRLERRGLSDGLSGAPTVDADRTAVYYAPGAFRLGGFEDVARASPVHGAKVLIRHVRFVLRGGEMEDQLAPHGVGKRLPVPDRNLGISAPASSSSRALCSLTELFVAPAPERLHGFTG